MKSINQKNSSFRDEETSRFTITIRKSTLEKLEEIAALKYTDPEDLADEMIEKGLRKRTARDPKKLETLVRLQQDFNDLIEGVDQDDLKQNLTECMRRFLELW